MKKICALLAMCLLFTCPAAAEIDASALLKPIWLTTLEEMNKAKPGETAPEKTEPIVTVADERLEVVRSAVYMEDEYGCEAHVFAEIRNVTDDVLVIQNARIDVCDNDGRRVHKEDYISITPEIVMPGETFYVCEWLYDFVSSLDRVAEMKVEAETSDYGRRWLERTGDAVTAEMWTEKGEMFLRVRNTTTEPAYNLRVLGVLSDAQGKILDVFARTNGSDMAIDGESALVFKRTIPDYVSVGAMEGCTCSAYVYRIEY